MGIKKRRFQYDIAITALFVAIIIICSWVSIPFGTVPLTLQLFGVITAAGLLKLKRGFFAVLLYILLGAMGLPVFHSFTGGVGVLMGSTGGYIFGFLLCAFVVGLFAKLKGRGFLSMLLASTLGTAVCYTVGVLWYAIAFSNNQSIGAIIMTTVVPFLVFDFFKIIAASLVISRVSKYVD